MIMTMFAKGLDPFTMKIKTETSAKTTKHRIELNGLDSSDEWRFQIMYQFGEDYLYKSPIVYPFAQGKKTDAGHRGKKVEK
jgi:hypothetical protein